jgi:hypothetical protein
MVYTVSNGFPTHELLTGDKAFFEIPIDTVVGQAKLL